MRKILCLFAILCGCSNVHHGYKFEEGDKTTMQEMVNQHKTIQEIINHFGSPTFINSPINDLVCYTSVDGKSVPFNRFYKPKYDFACIKIENGIAKSLEQKTFDDIKEEKLISYDNKIDELVIIENKTNNEDRIVKMEELNDFKTNNNKKNTISKKKIQNNKLKKKKKQ